MQRGRLLVLVGLLLLLGTGVVALVFFLSGGVFPGTATPTPEPTVVPEVPMVQVVIATQKLPRGEKIEAGQLGSAPWPQGALPANAITDPALVVGKLARYDIDPGEAILVSLLADDPSTLSATGSEAALKIPEGQVAISLPMTRLSTVGYGIRDGDHINILVSLLFVDVAEATQSLTPEQWTAVVKSVDPTTQTATLTLQELGIAGTFLDDNPLLPEVQVLVRPSEVQRPRLVVQQIVQDAVVLKVGTFTDADVVISLPTPTPLPEGSPPPPPTAVPPPDIITLIVPPQDALVLTYFMFAKAKFTMVLRAAGDTSRVDTESVTLQYAVERFRISVPTPLNFSLEPSVRKLENPTLPNEPLPVIIPLPSGTTLCGGNNCP